MRRLEDGALFRVELNASLESGETTELIFQCENTLPVMQVNYGVARDGEIQLASFHLQLAVYDGKGWDNDPACENGDGRYSQASDYLLRITAPREYQVVCTGTETAREEILLNETLLEERGDRGVWHFQADRRREIVIAAFTDYRRMERTVGNTTVIGYFNTLKVSEKAAREAFEAAVFAVDYYGRIFGEYPCETLVFTNAGWSVSAPANMEYSGHITVDMGERVDVSTVYHEVAHQWFYYLVGNDENEEAWLDESFASFCSYLCQEEAGDEKNADIWWNFCKEIAGRHPGEKLNVSSDSMGKDYMNLCYFRGTYFLKELMDTMGRESFFEAVSEYCARYAFENATTWDLLHILQAHTQRDLSGLFEEYVEEAE